MATVIDASQAHELVREFRQQVRLVETDAYRSAFCALAWHRGWPTARIGRYLGISRARVGQRIEKLRYYVQTHGDDMPVLQELLATANRPEPGRRNKLDLHPVAFEQTAWLDRRFARGLLDQIVS